MCGIFGYYGRDNATQKVIQGLKRLEYRGYDSWGVTHKTDESIFLHKEIGEIGDPSDHEYFPQSNVAIGHTRWATHGGVSVVNAHPHISIKHNFALAHNGIVENYAELKEAMISEGENFESQTDTEVILKIIETELANNNGDFLSAVKKARKTIDGRNTFIVLDFSTNNIYVSKNGSPALIGFTKNKDEIYFSSDAHSFAPWVEKITVLEDGQIAYWTGGKGCKLLDKNNKEIEIKKEKVNIGDSKVDKEGYDHFMLKEIHDTPYAIKQIINSDETELERLAKAIKKARNIYCVGSGSSGRTAQQIAYYLRKYGNVNAQGLIGAEATEYFNIFSEDDLIIAPSQSGETADVLEVLEVAREKNVKIASIVNMVGSTMTRISDFQFLSNSGPEICVMTTKVLTAQMAWGYLLAKTVQGKHIEGKNHLNKLIKAQKDLLSDELTLNKIKKCSKRLAAKEHIYMLAKGQNLQVSGEGMVKIIEGAYIHAHAMPAGDLKHYAITLMEEGTDVVVTISDDENKVDVLSAMAEVQTRGAKVTALSNFEIDNTEFFILLPSVKELDALVNILAFQLISYYMALIKDNNIDKPRNIAKSVTVK